MGWMSWRSVFCWKHYFRQPIGTKLHFLVIKKLVLLQPLWHNLLTTLTTHLCIEYTFFLQPNYRERRLSSTVYTPPEAPEYSYPTSTRQYDHTPESVIETENKMIEYLVDHPVIPQHKNNSHPQNIEWVDISMCYMLYMMHFPMG